MDRIARADEAERRLVFEAAAVRLGTTPGSWRRTSGCATPSSTCSTAAPSRRPSPSKGARACPRRSTSSSASRRTWTSYSTGGRWGTGVTRRYSRHYYDLYRLGNSPVLERALEDTALLARVVEFKEKFYRTPWARLSEACPGSLRLVPPEFRVGELEADYRSMAPMLFGEYPTFEEIVRYMGDLEERINALS